MTIIQSTPGFFGRVSTLDSGCGFCGSFNDFVLKFCKATCDEIVDTIGINVSLMKSFPNVLAMKEIIQHGISVIYENIK